MIDKKHSHPTAKLPTGSVFAFIDKPIDWTSHDCVHYLRKAFRGIKMGHGGTLDPFATGLLPIFFDQWTRLSDLFTLSDKRYQAELQLGTRTDTGDFTGKVVQKGSNHVGMMSYKLLEKTLVGPIKLPIPIYSALKIDGTPMYELARHGKLVEPVRYRKTIIYDISLSQPAGDKINIDVHCSHGTYIRSLGEHIAQKLKTCGHLSQLRRVAYYKNNQPYSLAVATPDDLIARPAEYIVTVDRLADYLPVYEIGLTEVRHFLTGRLRRAAFKIEGWHVVRIGLQNLGVVLFEKGKITQRIFVPQQKAPKILLSPERPVKWSWYD